MTALNAEGDVDNAYRVHFAAVDADCVALERADRILVQVGVAAQESFADAGPFTTCVTEGGLYLTIYVH